MSQPKMLSNAVFVAGGIYPGGQILVKEFCFRLWDYGGTRPPNSEMAVYCLGQPLDGSNDGKDVDIFWNCGPATDFQPVGNGEFAVSPTREGFSDQSNWHFVFDKFVKNCGLKANMLDGQSGLRAMIGSVIQLARMPGPARSFNNQEQPAQGQQPRKAAEVLVPVRVQYAWDKPGAGVPAQAAQPLAPAPAPMAAPLPVNGFPAASPAVGFNPAPTPMPAPMAAPAPVPMAAPAPMAAAPAPSGDPMAQILNAINAMIPAQGAIEVSRLWVPLIGQLPHLTTAQRTPLLNQVKDNIEAYAMQCGWRYDGTTMTLSR